MNYTPEQVSKQEMRRIIRAQDERFAETRRPLSMKVLLDYPNPQPAIQTVDGLSNMGKYTVEEFNDRVGAVSAGGKTHKDQAVYEEKKGNRGRRKLEALDLGIDQGNIDRSKRAQVTHNGHNGVETLPMRPPHSRRA